MKMKTSSYLVFLLSTVLSHCQGTGKLEISTDVYAHYAMTTVEATFETGDESTEVHFYFTIPQNAYVTGLDIVVNNITCSAIIEELEVARKQLGEAIKGKNQHTEQVRTPTDRLRIRPARPDEIFCRRLPLRREDPSRVLRCAGCGCSGWRSVGR